MEILSDSDDGEEWRISTFCESAACVEVNPDLARGVVGLRSTNNPEQVLRFSAGAWREFVGNIALLGRVDIV